MQASIQDDFVARYKDTLQEYSASRSANYSVTPFPLLFGSQTFFINSKILIIGLGQNKKYGVRCTIANLSRNGFVEINVVALNKLLQSLDEILRITFSLKTSKVKIELDENVFIKFTKRQMENLAFVHDIKRNSRIFLEGDDIRKLMLLFYPINIAIERVTKNAQSLQETYKAYILLMTNTNSSQILSTVGLENAIPVSIENPPFWMELSDEFLKIPLYFNEYKRTVDQTVLSLFPEETLF